MIFQTETQLKELGEKITDEHKTANEYALTELRMAHQSQDLEAIQKGLDNMNAAWKTDIEEMYTQRNNADASGQQAAQPQADAQGDDVQDAEFEEVK